MKMNLGLAGLENNQSTNKRVNSEDKKPHDTVVSIFSRYDKENKDIEYLILSHKKYNQLTFPIGKVKDDQSIVEAMIVENREELGVDVENYMEVLQFQREYEVDGKEIPDKIHIFKIVKYNGTPKNVEPKKHDWIKWMTRSEIEETQRRLAVCITRYFAWLDDINAPSLTKPQVTVGQGK